MKEAAALGVRELFRYTSTARRLYERLGWTVLREDAYQGEQVAVMALRLA